eukprot:6469923-Amphidinium_carterae.1
MSTCARNTASSSSVWTPVQGFVADTAGIHQDMGHGILWAAIHRCRTGRTSHNKNVGKTLRMSCTKLMRKKCQMRTISICHMI